VVEQAYMIHRMGHTHRLHERRAHDAALRCVDSCRGEKVLRERSGRKQMYMGYRWKGQNLLADGASDTKEHGLDWIIYLVGIGWDGTT
jgi:hypothetical protein